MKKWMSLLLAGVLASMFLVGCNKEEEGSTTTPPANSADGKMDAKANSDAVPAPETKMEGETK